MVPARQSKAEPSSVALASLATKGVRSQQQRVAGDGRVGVHGEKCEGAVPRLNFWIHEPRDGGNDPSRADRKM
jgi:hypothetical protein